MKSYGVIMKSYKRERERVIMKSYKREREGVGTIGLDWLLGVLLGGWRGLGRIPAALVSSAWPSPHPSPHSPLPQSFLAPLSSSI